MLPDLSKLLFHARFEVESHLSKKNNRPIFRNKYTGRPTLGKSSGLKMGEHLYLYKLRQQKVNLNIDTLVCPLSATFIFYFPKNKFFTAKGTVNKNIPDLSNLYELPQDCLTKSGVIFDDGQIFSHDFSRRLPHDKDVYEVEILLSHYDLTQDQPRYNISPSCLESESPRRK